MEIEQEVEVEHVCPKCGRRWKTVEIVVVNVEAPEREEDYR